MPLAGQPCLVLRPAPDGERLCAALRSLGLVVRHLPSLEIHPILTADPPAPPADIIVFVSRNAVRHGIAVVSSAPKAAIAAIGAGTAAELAATGQPPDILPPEGYDSEALLQAPALADPRGAIVWIVRGRGGRALLGDTLSRRGARVHYIEVYERRLAEIAPPVCAEALTLLTGDTPPWLVATSVESLEALHRLLGRSALHYRLVTASDRVVKLGTERDRVALVLRAHGPDADSLSACLRAWDARQPQAPDTA